MHIINKLVLYFGYVVLIYIVVATSYHYYLEFTCGEIRNYKLIRSIRRFINRFRAEEQRQTEIRDSVHTLNSGYTSFGYCSKSSSMIIPNDAKEANTTSKPQKRQLMIT